MIEPTDWEKELKDEWYEYHQELYLPGSAICTATIFKWWTDKVKSLLEAEREKTVFKIEKELMAEYVPGTKKSIKEIWEKIKCSMVF
jgi:hypothetical protein